MERLRDRDDKSGGLNRNTIRAWGLVFLALGIVGRSVLQNRLLGIGTVSTEELLAVMQASQSSMLIATVALALQALETCAIPVFAVLLLEGFQYTSDLKNYLLRVAGLAVLSELPYNLAMSGKLLDLSSRNPVFGLVLGLILLYFYQRYEEKSFQNFLIKVLVAVAAVLWTGMLRIDYGACLVLVVCALWIFRGNTLARNLAGATVTVVCSLSSPFFLAAPMGFLLIHFYNGERDVDNRLVNYLAYPVMLLLIGVVALVIG